MRYAFLAIAVLALVGCNRVASTTTLNSDGSLHEKLSLKVSDMQGLMSGAGLPGMTPGAAGAKEDPFAKAFKFDATGAKITKTQQSDVKVLTIERDVEAGAPHPDFQILSDKGQPETDCKIQGRKLPNGDLEYDAIVQYVGPANSDVLQIDPTTRAAVKSALPARYQTTEKIDAVTHAVEAALGKIMFGPPIPEITSLMINPDLSTLLLGSELKSVIEAEAPKSLPDLTPAEQERIAQKLTAAMNIPNMMNQQKTSHMGAMPGAGGNGNAGMGSMTSLLYEVSFKGTIVETNGINDPLTGHVYWCFYAVSAALSEVRLHLVIRPSA